MGADPTSQQKPQPSIRTVMSMVKKEFFQEINRPGGMGTQWEPYIFRFIVQFAYQGDQHTLFADTVEGIEKLAQDILGEPANLVLSGLESVLVADDITIPVILIQVSNPRYY